MPKNYPEFRVTKDPRSEILQRIEELKDRLKNLDKHDKQLVELLDFVRKRSFDRTDIAWLYNQLPKQRITMADRLAKVTPGVTTKKVEAKPRSRTKPKTKLAAMLRRARKEAGLSPQQLAEQTGVSLVSLYAWENGKHKPTKDKMTKLEEILKLKLPST